LHKLDAEISDKWRMRNRRTLPSIRGDRHRSNTLGLCPQCTTTRQRPTGAPFSAGPGKNAPVQLRIPHHYFQTNGKEVHRPSLRDCAKDMQAGSMTMTGLARAEGHRATPSTAQESLKPTVWWSGFKRSHRRDSIQAPLIEPVKSGGQR